MQVKHIVASELRLTVPTCDVDFHLFVWIEFPLWCYGGVTTRLQDLFMSDRAVQSGLFQTCLVYAVNTF